MEWFTGGTGTGIEGHRSGVVARAVTPVPVPDPRPASIPGPGRYRPPVVSPSDLRREHLLAALVEDPAPVSLICAPAGAGKTSLVAGLAAEVTAAGGVIGWLSLDHRDTDPFFLWTGIVESLRASGGFPPASRLHVLDAPPLRVDPGFIEAVVAELAAVDAPVWLVLEDVHVLRSAASLTSIDDLLRQLPSDVHVVLTSRSDPPLGLARLRVQGQLRELHATELSFTVEETSTFLRRRQPQLPDELIRSIHERTEGWAAGVAIAAAALQGTDDPAALVEGFGGDDHLVADYLVSEVLATLPPELLTFLLRTSVCSRLSVGLAQHLTGRQDAATVLDTLVRDNVLTDRLGRGRESYRYHELLRTFLLGELRRSEPGLEPALHAMAGSWWQTHEPLHAMEHLIRSDDPAALAELVDTEGMALLLEGRARGLLETLSGLDDRWRTDPRIALVGAASALAVGDLDETDRWLGGVELPAIIGGPDASLAAFAATVAVARARDEGGIDLALQALESTSAGATGDRDRDQYALYHRAVARGYVGRYTEALDDIERAVASARVSGRTGLLVDCLSWRAGGHVALSQFPEMRRSAQRALGLAELHGWGRSGAVAHARMLVSWSDFLRADDAAALVNANAALVAMDEHVEPQVELACRTLRLFTTASGGGGYQDLRDYWRTLFRLVDAPMSPSTLALAAPLLVRLCLDLGERSMAQEIADAVRSRAPDPGEPALLRAMLLHDAGRYEAARSELAAVFDRHARSHVVTTEVRIHLLAAELDAERGSPTTAHEHLCEAIRIAEPVEVLQPFLESQRVRDLLTSGRGRFGRFEPFVQQVLVAASARASDVTNETRLTPGELTVLRELPSLQSLRQIAESLSLSPNTVKFHLRSIYRKLGVAGRREAVEAARHRGLL
jgi:LuxR family transcriptional regulator, maltose regulon positive regulatory protein